MHAVARSVPLAIVAALLVAGAAQATGEQADLADLEVDLARVQGDWGLEADLVALAHGTFANRTIGAAMPTPVPIRLDGNAKALEVTRTWTDVSLGVVKAFAQQETISYSRASFEATEVRTGATIHAFSLDPADPAAVRQAGQCAQFGASEEDRVERNAYVDARDPGHEAPADEAVMEIGCSVRDVTLTGSFLLFFWETDLRIEGREGSHTFATGERPLAPSAGPLMHAEEIRLTVRNGTFHFPDMPHESRLFLDNVRLAVSGSVLLEGASGQAAGHAVQGTILADGALRLLFESQGVNQRLGVAVAGQADRILVGGEPLPLDLVMRPPRSDWRDGLLAAALLAASGAMVAAAWRPARRHAARRLLRKAVDAHEKGLLGDAIHLATRALQHNPRLGPAYYHRAMALHATQDFDAALADHEAANRFLAERPGHTTDDLRILNARQAARVSAARGDPDLAVWWLQVATRLDPELRHQVEATVESLQDADSDASSKAYG